MKLQEKINRYGKWSLVTGGSDGIGKDFALELASLGQSLILVATSETKLIQIKQFIKSSFGVPVETYNLDLSRLDNVKELEKICKEKDIGTAILAAGYGSLGSFQNLDIQKELDMIQVNCTAVVSLSHFLLNQFLQKKKGAIVFFGSLVGFQGVPWTSTYSSTKSFVQSFAEGLRGELKSKGIDVLSVAPGPVNSNFGSRAGMKMGSAQSTDGIAKESLKALGKKTTVRPGFLSKFLGYSLIILPRGMRSFILKNIMETMKNV